MRSAGRSAATAQKQCDGNGKNGNKNLLHLRLIYVRCDIRRPDGIRHVNKLLHVLRFAAGRKIRPKASATERYGTGGPAETGLTDMRRGADRQGPYNVCDYDRTRTGFVGKGAVGCGQSRIIVRFIPNDQQVGNRKYSRWQYQMFRERCKHLGHIYFQVARRRFRPVGIGTMFMLFGAVGSRRKTVFEIEADTLAAIVMVMRKRRQPQHDDAQ